MYKILVIDIENSKMEFLKHTAETAEACKADLEFLAIDLLSMGFEAFCVVAGI